MAHHKYQIMIIRYNYKAVLCVDKVMQNVVGYFHSFKIQTCINCLTLRQIM